MRRTCRGFTLIDLMIVIAIIGVLSSIAVSAYSDAIAASHASAARAALLKGIMRASNYAATMASHVVLCPSQEGSDCTGSPDWSPGWIIFIDRDGDRSRAITEPLLDSYPALDERVRLASTAGRARIVFQPNGGNAGSNVTFTLCDTRGPEHGQSLVLGNAGTLREGTPNPARLQKVCPRS